MEKSTIVKKYRIFDYSKMDLDDLMEHLDFFYKKVEVIQSKKMDHKFIKNHFSLFLNLYNITEELFKREPSFKDRIDFEGAIQDILNKNSINANKN